MRVLANNSSKNDYGYVFQHYSQTCWALRFYFFLASTQRHDIVNVRICPNTLVTNKRPQPTLWSLISLTAIAHKICINTARKRNRATSRLLWWCHVHIFVFLINVHMYISILYIILQRKNQQQVFTQQSLKSDTSKIKTPRQRLIQQVYTRSSNRQRLWWLVPKDENRYHTKTLLTMITKTSGQVAHTHTNVI